MRDKNFNLLNTIIEDIWDLESFRVNDETLDDVRRQLKNLQKLCIKLA